MTAYGIVQLIPAIVGVMLPGGPLPASLYMMMTSGAFLGGAF